MAEDVGLLPGRDAWLPRGTSLRLGGPGLHDAAPLELEYGGARGGKLTVSIRFDLGSLVLRSGVMGEL